MKAIKNIMNNQTWQRSTKRTRPISNGVNNFYLKISLVFCGMMLLVSLYFILFSLSIGGDYHLYINKGDFVNMASFAFISTTLITALFWTGGAGRNVPLLAALGILTIIMILVVSINRYLAVYPTSGAEALFFYVGILDFLAALFLPIGVGMLVGFSIIFTQKHDPVRSRFATETQSNNYDR